MASAPAHNTRARSRGRSIANGALAPTASQDSIESFTPAAERQQQQQPQANTAQQLTWADELSVGETPPQGAQLPPPPSPTPQVPSTPLSAQGNHHRRESFSSNEIDMEDASYLEMGMILHGLVALAQSAEGKPKELCEEAIEVARTITNFTLRWGNHSTLQADEKARQLVLQLNTATRVQETPKAPASDTTAAKSSMEKTFNKADRLKVERNSIVNKIDTKLNEVLRIVRQLQFA